MFFSKKDNSNDTIVSSTCPCTSNQGLYLTMRQVSGLISALLLLMFFVFMGGYFLGQKKVLEQFSSKLEQDSLSDKIYSSLYAMYDTPENDESDTDQNDAGTDDLTDQLKVTDAQSVKPGHEIQKESDQNKTVQHNNSASEIKKQYYAQLAGFGSAQPAYAFAEKLNKQAKIALVKKHESKSAKGRIRYWYQVITKLYESKEQLTQVVAKIKQEERLKDIRIVSC